MTDLTTGQRIAQCRKQLNLSQEALGEKVGVSRQAISKWEADAALPDIDKLITLSRLFQVSVGWLLGVEKMPEAQPETPQISEELLRKIEETVKRYQPQRKKPPLWAILCLITVVLTLLWGGVRLRDQWQSMDARLSQLSSRLNASDNSAILNQLDNLQEQLDSLSSAPERFSIADWSYQIEPDSENAQAVVMLSAIPGFWQEDYTAVLSVRLDGEQVVSQACAWDGAALTARLILPLENGYEYWLTAKYADGTQEQVELPNSTARNLKSAFTIQCHITHGEGRFSLQKGTLEFTGYDIHLSRPSITSGYDVDWVSTELILYHIRGSDRQIVYTDDQFSHDYYEQSPPDQIVEFWLYPKGPYPLPELVDGDGLELWISAEMSNGIRLMQMVDSWAYLDGEFITGTPVAPLA